jgi:hypothetical protein
LKVQGKRVLKVVLLKIEILCYITPVNLWIVTKAPKNFTSRHGVTFPEVSKSLFRALFLNKNKLAPADLKRPWGTGFWCQTSLRYRLLVSNVPEAQAFGVKRPWGTGFWCQTSLRYRLSVSNVPEVQAFGAKRPWGTGFRCQTSLRYRLSVSNVPEVQAFGVKNKNSFVENSSPDDCGNWARGNFLEFLCQLCPGGSVCFAKQPRVSKLAIKKKEQVVKSQTK